MKRAYKIIFALLALLLLTGCQEKKTQAEITLPEPKPPAAEKTTAEPAGGPEEALPEEKPETPKLPTPAASMFGLTGTEAVLYDAAVSQKYPREDNDIVLPSLRVYGTFEDGGRTVVICGLHYDFYYDYTGPGWAWNGGGATTYLRAELETQNGAEVCTGFAEYPSGSLSDWIRDNCGPLAVQNADGAWVLPEAAGDWFPSDGDMLSQYLDTVEEMQEPSEPEPPMPETARTQQEQKMMDARLFSATVCTCLTEDSARWHLRELGIETDAPSEDFSAAMEAFRASLPMQYAEDTFWLIDRRGDGLTLQFWKFDEGSHAGYFSCTDALCWEPGMEKASPIGENLVLGRLYFAPCAANAPEEERTRVEENYARLSENHASGAGWRVSMAPDGKLALMALDPERGGELFYACGQTSGPLVWSADDLPQGTNDALYRALCGVDFDESVLAEEKQNLLRGFLASSLYADGFIPWDGPRPADTFDEVQLAYDLKNAFWTLLREFRADEAQGEDFLKNGPWTLFHDGGACFHLTNEEGRIIEISAPLP